MATVWRPLLQTLSQPEPHQGRQSYHPGARSDPSWGPPTPLNYTTPGPYLLSVRGGFNGEERDLHSDAIHSEERRIFRPLYFASPHESRMTPRATGLLRPAHGELKQSMRTKPAWGKHKALAIRTFRHCTAYFRRWAIHKYTPHTPRRQMPPTHSFLSKHDNTIRV